MGTNKLHYNTVHTDKLYTGHIVFTVNPKGHNKDIKPDRVYHLEPMETTIGNAVYGIFILPYTEGDGPVGHLTQETIREMWKREEVKTIPSGGDGTPGLRKPPLSG